MTPDIIGSFEQPYLFEQFKLQLNRDFELCGFVNYVPNLQSNDLTHIYNAILFSITQIEKYHTNGLMNLLYRVDVTELQIKQLAKKEPNKTLQQLAAELIIKRVLQKVILKRLYK